MQGLQHENVNTCKFRTAVHNGYCKYLNSGLLEAPREYILHGLVPAIDRTPLWTFLMSVHLVAMPQCLLLSGWLLTNVQINITTTSHDTEQTCIYITLVLLFIFFLHLFHFPVQAGCPPFPPSITFISYFFKTNVPRNKIIFFKRLSRSIINYFLHGWIGLCEERNRWWFRHFHRLLLFLYSSEDNLWNLPVRSG